MIPGDRFQAGLLHAEMSPPLGLPFFLREQNGETPDEGASPPSLVAIQIHTLASSVASEVGVSSLAFALALDFVASGAGTSAGLSSAN